jgi:hypothetical protein
METDMSLTILDQVKALNVEISNWCSDLYIPITEATTLLINKYEFKQNVTSFKSETDGVWMYEIPFAFTPYHKS